MSRLVLVLLAQLALPGGHSLPVSPASAPSWHEKRLGREGTSGVIVAVLDNASCEGASLSRSFTDDAAGTEHGWFVHQFVRSVIVGETWCLNVGGDSKALFAALDYLAGKAREGSRVVAVSAVCSFDTPDGQWAKAFTKAMDAGVVVVAAAGNNGKDSGERGPGWTCPAPCGIPGVICVSAVDQYGELYELSSYGERVDVAAPGVGLTATRKNGVAATVSGTSFAAPVAAGMVARFWGTNPTLKAKDVRTAYIRYCSDQAKRKGVPAK